MSGAGISRFQNHLGCGPSSLSGTVSPIKNLFEEGECEPAATIRKFRIVQTEGARQVEREVDTYNLDVILSTPSCRLIEFTIADPEGWRARRFTLTEATRTDPRKGWLTLIAIVKLEQIGRAHV